MPKLSLSTLLGNLVAQRQEHLDALAEIDALFARAGLTVAAPQTAARKPGRPAKVGRPRRRRHYDQTAEEFVLGLLAGKSLTTAQVNKAWKATGRKSSADNTLGKLAKEKRVKRAKVKGERGSSYSIA